MDLRCAWCDEPVATCGCFVNAPRSRHEIELEQRECEIRQLQEANLALRKELAYATKDLRTTQEHLEDLAETLAHLREEKINLQEALCKRYDPCRAEEDGSWRLEGLAVPRGK